MNNEFREPWRFWSKVQTAESGCWEWTGAKSPIGYGSCTNYAEPDKGRRKNIAAHRLVWLLERGPIPPNLQIDHLCCNKGCVNPDHLELVTQRENLLRGDTLAARNAAKTHCRLGHPYDGFTPYGRRCGICNRLAQAKFRAKVRTP